jgi:hypothetical protein
VVDLYLYLYRCNACLHPSFLITPRPLPESLGQSAWPWPLPCRVRIESNARDSEVRVSFPIGNVEGLQPHFDENWHCYERIRSAFARLHVYPAAQCNTESEKGLVGTDISSAT